MPDLTIGFPVYNGGVLLRRALELLNQTYRDFVPHISDNASTDETQLCRQFAARDGRNVYARRPQNI
jgi:glycosyltransferase involved in cell wall biosynthesis